MGQICEVECICCDNSVYNLEKVKNFLKEVKFSEMFLFMVVCDCFNFVYDLVFYLYQYQQFKFIEVYVQ